MDTVPIDVIAVAGQQVVDSLTAAGVAQAEPYLFPGTPTLYASYDNVELIREVLRGMEAGDGLEVVRAALDFLPPAFQRAVGWSSPSQP